MLVSLPHFLKDTHHPITSTFLFQMCLDLFVFPVLLNFAFLVCEVHCDISPRRILVLEAQDVFHKARHIKLFLLDLTSALRTEVGFFGSQFLGLGFFLVFLFSGRFSR